MQSPLDRLICARESGAILPFPDKEATPTERRWGCAMLNGVGAKPHRSTIFAGHKPIRLFAGDQSNRYDLLHVARPDAIALLSREPTDSFLDQQTVFRGRIRHILV